MPPSSDSVAKLIEFALDVDREFGVMLALIAWTGCRRGEVCGLRWRDVDLDAQELLFERSVVAVPGGKLEKSTKTGDSRRIALGPATVALLVAHRALRDDVASQFGRAISKDGFVFSPEPTMIEAWHPQTVSHRFLALCRQSGVPRMRLHDLRHHSATALLKNGVSVGEVMDRHGWKTLEMVSRHRHLTEAKDRTAAEAIERIASPRSSNALSPYGYLAGNRRCLHIERIHRTVRLVSDSTNEQLRAELSSPDTTNLERPIAGSSL